MSEYVTSRPTPEEREADGWTLEGEWELVKQHGNVVTRRRPWVRVSVERTYEYMTRVE